MRIRNILFLLVFCYIISESSFGSAECGKSTHVKNAIGEWSLKTLNNEIFSLHVSNDGHFFGGYILNKKTKIKIPVSVCEGDCCNSFFEESGSLNFMADKTFGVFKKGRNSLYFHKIDWSIKKAEGQILNSNSESVSTFQATKIK